jgi:hypothetical protein
MFTRYGNVLNRWTEKNTKTSLRIVVFPVEFLTGDINILGTLIATRLSMQTFWIMNPNYEVAKALFHSLCDRKLVRAPDTKPSWCSWRFCYYQYEHGGRIETSLTKVRHVSLNSVRPLSNYILQFLFVCLFVLRTDILGWAKLGFDNSSVPFG